MSKVLVMVRVSTEGQDTTDQRREMLEFVQQQGYSENNIVWIEERGASAIKLNDKYLGMIDEIKSMINQDRDIDCFALWHLNRGFRNEVIFYQLKEYLITNKIQLLVKNPYLKLLNDDKTVNAGTELAFSLLMTLAQQDMLEKKAKFRRAKKGNSENHKFNGGSFVKYGYRIDEDGFVVPDEEDSKVVREIFELYSTGLYSTRTLANELQARGYEPSRNSLLTPEHEKNRKAWVFQTTTIKRMLSDTAYIGYTDSSTSHRKYIPIISQELWDKVSAIRDKNNLHISRAKKFNLASKIIKCPMCGQALYNGGAHYACYHHRTQSKLGGTCNFAGSIKAEIADSLIWYVAYMCEQDNSKTMTREREKEIKQTYRAIAQKQYTLKTKIEQQGARKKKIVDAYLDDLITLAERDTRLAKLTKDISEYQAQINTYEEQLHAIRSSTPNKSAYNLPAQLSKITNMDNLKICQSLARKHIETCLVDRVSYGERNPKRAKNPNAYLFEVKTYLIGTLYYMYFPQLHKGHHVYQYDITTQSILEPILEL